MRKRKDQQSDSPLVDDAPLPIDDELEQPAPLPLSPPPKAVKALPGRWRVVREAIVNVNGSFTRLTEGQVLDPLGYSESVIESLRAQNVELEPAE